MEHGQRRGLTSLDALITFIAIVLVTGVVAIFLLTSGSSLTQRIMSKGGEAKKGVTSGFEVINVLGRGANPSDVSPHVIDDLEIMVRLLPGTVSIPLNSTLIIVDIEGEQTTITFNFTCQGECLAPSTSLYNVFYIKEGSNHEDDYLNSGDVVKVALKPGGGIGEDIEVKVGLIPPQGPATNIRFQTPQFMTARLITLWPVA